MNDLVKSVSQQIEGYPTLSSDQDRVSLDIKKAEELRRLAGKDSDPWPLSRSGDGNLPYEIFEGEEVTALGIFHSYRWRRGSIVKYWPSSAEGSGGSAHGYYLDLSSNRLSSELPAWSESYWFNVVMHHPRQRKRQFFHATFERATSESGSEARKSALYLADSTGEGGFLKTCSDFTPMQPYLWKIRLGCCLISDSIRNSSSRRSQVFRLQALGQAFKFNWTSDKAGRTYSLAYTPGWALWAFVYHRGTFQPVGRNNRAAMKPIELDTRQCEYYDVQGVGIIWLSTASPKPSGCGYFENYRLGVVTFRCN